jgi:hypothetical protein
MLLAVMGREYLSPFVVPEDPHEESLRSLCLQSKEGIFFTDFGALSSAEQLAYGTQPQNRSESKREALTG